MWDVVRGRDLVYIASKTTKFGKYCNVFKHNIILQKEHFQFKESHTIVASLGCFLAGVASGRPSKLPIEDSEWSMDIMPRSMTISGPASSGGKSIAGPVKTVTPQMSTARGPKSQHGFGQTGMELYCKGVQGSIILQNGQTRKINYISI